MQQQQKQLGSTYSTTGANFSAEGNNAAKSPNSSIDRKVLSKTLQLGFEIPAFYLSETNDLFSFVVVSKTLIITRSHLHNF